MPQKFKPVCQSGVPDVKCALPLTAVHCNWFLLSYKGFSLATPLLSEMRSLLDVVCVLLQSVNFSHNVGLS